MSEAPSPEGVPAPDVEFKSNAVFTSAEGVVTPEVARDRKKTRIRAAGKSTVVLREGASEVDFFDDSGEKMGMKGSLTVADWGGFREANSLGDRDFVIASAIQAGVPNLITVDELPGTLRETARGIFARSGQASIPLPKDSWKVDTSDLSKIAVDVDEGGLFVYQSGTAEKYVGFLGRDAAGQPLEVNNWRRADLTNVPSPLPDDLSERINYLPQAGVESVYVVGTGATVVVTETGLTVNQTLNPSSPSIFSENLPHIGNNVAREHAGSGVVFYCTETMQSLYKYDINAGGSVAEIQPLPGGKEYHGVHNLRLDQSGNFITFSADEGFIVLDKETLQEKGNIPEVSQGMLDNQGQVRGINTDGKLVTYTINLDELTTAIQAEKAKAQAEAARKQVTGEDQADILAALEEKHKAFMPTREAMVENLQVQLGEATTLDNIASIRGQIEQQLDILRNDAATPGKMPLEAIDRLIQPILEAQITAREREVAAEIGGQHLNRLGELFAEPLEMSTYQRARTIVADLRSLSDRNLLPDELRAQLRDVEDAFMQKTVEFRRTTQRELTVLNSEAVRAVKNAIAKLSSTHALLEWRSRDILYEQIMARFNDILTLYTNSRGEVDAAVEGAVAKMRGAVNAEIEKRHNELEINEAEAGDTADELRDAKIDNLRDDISFVLRFMRGATPHTRAEIDALKKTAVYAGIVAKLDDPALRLDEKAIRSLKRRLGVDVSLLTAEVEREQLAGVDESGRPMIRFDDILVPVVQDVPQRPPMKDLELAYIEEPGSRQIVDGKVVTIGEIGVVESTTTHGGRNDPAKTETVKRRVREGNPLEGDWQNGAFDYLGEAIPGTIVTSAEYRDVLKQYSKWKESGREEVQKMRQELREFYMTRPVELPGGRRVTIQEAQDERKALEDAGDRAPLLDETRENASGEITHFRWKKIPDAAWEDQYKEKVQEMAEYVAANHVILFEKIDSLAKAPVTNVESNLGAKPEWNPSWVLDNDIEEKLGLIGKAINDQMEGQQGIAVLLGHAGTGKDVLWQMVANLTNRPLFTFDGSKFTTEKNLTEDLTLEDGSIVQVPSVVLRAIETDNAIMYFNEFTAMPEPTQLAIHALMDGKRSITRKSSPDAPPVRAKKTVVLAGSMNYPKYEGTFKPNPATASRMRIITIDYPGLMRSAETSDSNPNPAFSATDALRIARSVPSFEEYTYDLNLEHNMFVKIWDKHVNGIANDASDVLTAAQVFDLKTILGLVQFTDKIRTLFKQKFDQVPGARNVDAPITGRELFDCTLEMGRMTDEKRDATNPERFALALLEEYYLPKIFDLKHQMALRTDMLANWHIVERAVPEPPAPAIPEPAAA